MSMIESKKKMDVNDSPIGRLIIMLMMMIMIMLIIMIITSMI